MLDITKKGDLSLAPPTMSVLPNLTTALFYTSVHDIYLLSPQ